MLAYVEKYNLTISTSKNIEDLRAALLAVATGLGCQSAMVIELDERQKVKTIIDTVPARGVAFRRFVRETGEDEVAKLLRFRIDRGQLLAEHGEADVPDHPFQAFWKSHEMDNVAVVPVTRGAPDYLSVAAFCRAPALSLAQKAALQSLTYSIFAKLRSLETERTSEQFPLTRREHEVMRLTADGKSSAEIARCLGISKRTVNHYVFSAGAKLGSTKRAHTVAELLRRGIL